jgi:hypothetical protein
MSRHIKFGDTKHINIPQYYILILNVDLIQRSFIAADNTVS